MRASDGDNMGEVFVRVRLSNAGDVERARTGSSESSAVRTVEVDALVDTGSTRSVIPPEIAERLGLNVLAHATGRMADGSHVKVDICSPVAFEIMGRETFEDAYIMGSEVLIGQTVLETTDLLVDCRNRKVIFNPAHPEGPVFRL
jgi:clan AA aspartic protease